MRTEILVANFGLGQPWPSSAAWLSVTIEADNTDAVLLAWIGEMVTKGAHSFHLEQ